MSRTKTPPREIDLGWWEEPNGQRARLTWSTPNGRLLLHHPNGRPPEQLTAACSERYARDFVASLQDGEHTVERLVSTAGEWWSF